LKCIALHGYPKATSSNFEMGWKITHPSRGLLQVQPDGTLGKTLPLTSLAATMRPEWTLEG
jgi:hypothetical protein